MYLTIGLVTLAQPAISYSFIAAGHAYGSHDGENLGLHPPFLNSLNNGFDTSIQFMVFTGDIVNHSTAESWEQVEAEMENYNIPYYYSMGNHGTNTVGYSVFEAKYGGTYYSFDKNNDRFIVLNSTENDRSISANQLKFLKNKIDSLGDTTSNVFIFFHEIIWNSHEKYKGVKSNSRSRYDQMKNYSNYWTEVQPLLESYTKKQFYVIAGDVAGNPDAIPAFYDQWENVTLIASGMGEVEEENYMIVDILENGEVAFRLIPLRDNVTMNNIEFYNVPNVPSEIFGESIIRIDDLVQEYSVNEIENAQSYIWELPENVTGSSTSNIMNVDFSSAFTFGTISVKAYHESFGSSQAISKQVSMEGVGITQVVYKEGVSISLNGSYLHINGNKNSEAQLKVYDINGRVLFASLLNFEIENKQIVQLPGNFSGICIASIIQNNRILTSKKIVLE